jgi:NodT family efflux transporter outer membrane factor (OMF) lipoprotein
LLAACGTEPALRSPEPPAAEAALRARAAAVAQQPALLEGEPVPSEWWRLFQDEGLAALQRAAAQGNLDLLGAAVRIEESRAQLGLAEAARQPRLAAQGELARSALSERSPLARLGAPTRPVDVWSLGLEAGWEMDFAGYLRRLSESAATRVDANVYGMEMVRVSLAGDIARTYLLLRGVQAQQSVLVQNRAIARELLRVVLSRVRHGVATRFDAAVSTADIADIDARLTRLEHQQGILLNTLALLAGKPPREMDAYRMPAGLPPMPALLPSGLPSELARQRPDILQAEARLRAAVADIGAAHADFYPRVRLMGRAGFQAFEFSDLGSWNTRTFALGPAVHLPVFDGGRLTRNLALSEARHRAAALAYQHTVLRAWHEVDDALGAYASELERRTHLQRAQAAHQDALDAAQQGLREGSADVVPVLLARRSLLATQAELAECATASALSVVSLYRALGGGWSPELLEPTAPTAQAGQGGGRHE